MSEITFSGAGGAVVNLAPGESAYLIGSGEHTGVFVCVSVLVVEQDLNSDGNVDQVNLKVGGAIVDGLNVVQTTATGKPYKAPTETHSINAGALANGTVILEVEMARMIDECVHRVLRMKSILDVISAIPVAS